MDRNISEDVSYNIQETSLSARRAWIEIASNRGKRKYPESLSARRAWIEIDIEGKLDADLWVALRKESVDRNIVDGPLSLAGASVALRKESVDRNLLSLSLRPKSACRSPQGERG